MKNTALVLALAIAVLSCNQKSKEKTDATSQTEMQASEQKPQSDSTAAFDIEKIPYSNADLGTFPFFTLPKGLKEMNKPLQKDFDVCFFPINGVMKPFEGKLYKTFVQADEGTQFSQRYFEKSMEDYLKSIGAVKVFDGTITKEEYDRYHEQDPNKGGEGDIGYDGEQIKVYVIRSKDQGNIFVQYSATNASGKLNILQEKGFKQTMSKITADDIVKDLAEKGKSILYINFDTDKSSITADGKDVVSQIAEALKKDSNLNISIEGHTDNTGDAAHNKKLSNDRANAVMAALISQGISKSRLSAKGFGAERPLVANDSEDNKAKNRRVELVKIK
ncbi:MULTISPECIES: OmpA family protein [Chryseobacterium]|uniref:OOP family OmpA-OmpF porin n=1 Tax=Chryseobacterium camelliae TaxID=1265445 RepID=A0ABU0TLS4_9FLAO|nr:MULTISPECIES: OmpA family protein [Chryseobacterium]MDT3408970.1 OOP family OmpA-OmpF porin [Pseudacidovorax intermedius]MDQ1097173.1 OOP family OmpA-OmpF porin [Chryseobacterium camelliae]MDQ1101110.1 OOP family OmpA-OmpF porin [Chryseobacterium sp. SORGH_AS_1048]MDR6084553.1 OOP family OmpA-OmpF porin [Chryseobacterium sp. SORGH_AS_0909]MDR6132822.1 OOP family OmpA-OmpF porin [Chryseobacterium sp. SORGH_AS_1175]